MDVPGMFQTINLQLVSVPCPEIDHKVSGLPIVICFQCTGKQKCSHLHCRAASTCHSVGAPQRPKGRSGVRLQRSGVRLCSNRGVASTQDWGSCHTPRLCEVGPRKRSELEGVLWFGRVSFLPRFFSVDSVAFIITLYGRTFSTRWSFSA